MLTLAGCPGPSGAADTAAKTATNTATKTEAEPAPADKPEPVAAPEPEANDGFSSLEPAAPGPLPAWFSVDAFEHAKVIRQDERSSPLPTGQSATMIVLELTAGTTPAQCLEAAKTKLGESISELPEPTTTPQGYLTIKGKTSEYEYTVVCGIAKATPTMFLSVVQ
ncbi:hypothetical protein [Enhygromyxa salina]|uniref:hypothetical protein n=1 Tax=Enhygromyxa salina TaxID=215803 RepID=UPI0015E7657E|nr:hypothetical protein [Enhygromyxa salina]